MKQLIPFAMVVLVLLSACGETAPRYTAEQVIKEARMVSPACRGAIIGEEYG